MKKLLINEVVEHKYSVGKLRDRIIEEKQGFSNSLLNPQNVLTQDILSPLEPEAVEKLIIKLENGHRRYQLDSPKFSLAMQPEAIVHH